MTTPDPKPGFVGEIVGVMKTLDGKYEATVSLSEAYKRKPLIGTKLYTLAEPGTAALTEGARTYIDQLDAVADADAWLMAMVPTDKHRVFWNMERLSFSPQDGRLLVLRAHDKIVATAAIIRDSFNRSAVVKWAAHPAAVAGVTVGEARLEFERVFAEALAKLNDDELCRRLQDKWRAALSHPSTDR